MQSASALSLPFARRLIFLTLFALAQNAQSQTPAFTAYWAFGDSITAGIGASDTSHRYAQITADALHLPLDNLGLIGNQACDEFPNLIDYIVHTQLDSTTLFSMMIGTNDADNKGAGAYEPVFRACHTAALAWLGTPRENMVLAGDAAMTGAGGWSAASVNYYAVTGPTYDYIYVAQAAPGAPGTLTTHIATTGAPLYGWYMIDDNAGAGACFTVSIDGNSTGASYCARTTPAIATARGSTSSVAFLRIPVAAGQHTVVASTSTGGVALLGWGTLPPSGSWQPPVILSNDIPAQNTSNPIAPESTQLAYNNDVLTDEAMLNADGFHILHVPNRQLMTGDPSMFLDQVHPNDTGHQLLAQAQLAALQTGATSTSPYVTLSSTTTALTVKAGHSTSLPLQISSVDGFTGTVTLACPGTLPSQVTCTFQPASVSLAQNSTASATLTINTNAMLAAVRSTPAVTLALPLSACVLLFGWRKRRRLAASLTLFCIAISLCACGSGYPASTPPGTYNLTVQSTASESGHAPTTQTLHLKLVVTP